MEVTPAGTTNVCAPPVGIKVWEPELDALKASA
jgi:hypothetical protein